MKTSQNYLTDDDGCGCPCINMEDIETMRKSLKKKNHSSIKIKYGRWDENYRSLEILALIGKEWTQICTVSQGRDLDDDSPEEPVINWGARGTQKKEITLVFADALKEAARLAEVMEADPDWVRITPIPGYEWNHGYMPEVLIENGKIRVRLEGWELKK